MSNTSAVNIPSALFTTASLANLIANKKTPPKKVAETKGDGTAAAPKKTKKAAAAAAESPAPEAAPAEAAPKKKAPAKKKEAESPAAASPEPTEAKPKAKARAKPKAEAGETKTGAAAAPTPPAETTEAPKKKTVKKKKPDGEKPSAAAAATPTPQADAAAAAKGSGDKPKAKKKTTKKKAAAEGEEPAKAATGSTPQPPPKKAQEDSGGEDEFEADFEEEEEFEADFEEDDEEEEEEEEEQPADTKRGTTPAPQVPKLNTANVAGEQRSRSDPDVRKVAEAMAAENSKIGGTQQAQQQKKPQQKQKHSLLPERVVVDLAESKELNEAQRRVKRGKELQKMVQLDVSRCADLLDVPPMTQYEVYMSKFGRSNARQQWSQTGWDDRAIAVATEPPESSSKASQFPDTGASSLREILIGTDGGSGDDNAITPEERVSRLMAQVAHSVASERFPRFLRSSSRCVELLLDEAASVAAGIRSTFAVNTKWSNAVRRFSSPSYLYNRPVVDVCHSPSLAYSFVVTYGAVVGDGFLRDRGFVCVWNAQDTEQPAHVLTCDGQPTCACFAARSPFIVVAGTAEGAVVLWDLREPMAAHETVKIGQHNLLLRHPTFSSDAQRRENHLAPVIRIMPNESVNESESEDSEVDVDAGLSSSAASGASASKFATVDDQSFVSIWVAVQVASGGGGTDLGLAPQGSVRLVRSAIFSPFSARASDLGPDDPDVPVRAMDIAFNPSDLSQYLLATDTGQVHRGSRFASGVLFPHLYGDRGWPPPLSLGTSEKAPGCFLAGYDDGTLRMFVVDSEEPVAVWCGFAERASRVLWSPTRACVFFVVDRSNSAMHIFDLTLKQTGPALSETFAKMGVADKDNITAASVGETSLLIARASGTIDMFALVKQLCTAVDDTISESARLLEYTRRV